MKLIIISVLTLGMSLSSGCLKGGKRVGGSGIKNIISPSDLERQPNGTYKIKPKEYKLPPGNPVPTSPSKVEVENLPIPPKTTAKAKPHVVKNKAKPLPTAKANPILPKVNVIPINPDPEEKTNGGEVIVCKEEPDVTINLNRLLIFYASCLSGLIILWLLYKITKNLFNIFRSPKPRTRKKPRKTRKPKKS